jgi:hypothetical protein
MKDALKPRGGFLSSAFTAQCGAFELSVRSNMALLSRAHSFHLPPAALEG